MPGDPNGFLKFVAETLALAPSELPDVSKVNDAGNTFGAICVRLGLLTIPEIEDILEAQKNDRGRRFGEIAVELGLITERQIDGVLHLQVFYRSFEQAALLVVDGRLEMERLGQLWAAYAASRGPSKGPRG